MAKRKVSDIREVKLLDGSVRYRATFSDGSGSARRRTTRTFDTRVAAKEWLTKREADRYDGITYWAENMLIHEAFYQWMTKFKSNQVKESTMYTYGVTYRHLKAAIPDMKMSDLSGSYLQTQFNEWAKHYSVSTLRKWKAQINLFMSEIVLEGRMKANPMTRVKLPMRGITDDHHIKVLSMANYQKVVDYLFERPIQDDSAIYMILLFSALSGARVGESQSIKQDDINRFSRQIRIDQTYNRFTGKGDTPKTRASNRIVKVTDKFMQKLLDWQRYQQQMLIRTGKTAQDGMLMVRPDGTVPPAPNVLYEFHKIQRAVGIEAKDWIPTHGLRHTLVSVLIAKGIPIQYVSQMVGHASVSITQDTYQHLLHETKIATDETVVKLLDAL